MIRRYGSSDWLKEETADLSTTLRSPGIPVELGGVGALYAAFLNESSTRSNVQRSVAGNPGPVEMTNLWGGTRFRVSKKGPRNCRSLHGTPGQVGFARDDKGKGDISMESGCWWSFRSGSVAGIPGLKSETWSTLRSVAAGTSSRDRDSSPQALDLPGLRYKISAVGYDSAPAEGL
jgi:hypothetical protein